MTSTITDLKCKNTDASKHGAEMEFGARSVRASVIGNCGQQRLSYLEERL
jgi:hypothetical protein